MNNYMKNEDRALVAETIYLGPGRLSSDNLTSFCKIKPLLEAILYA
jgi:hypothetical protein